MEIIKPKIKLYTPINGVSELFKLETAARLCYKSEGKLNENNLGNVLKGCIANGHTSVLEGSSLTFNVVMDNGILREWTRHRIASYSIESTRYVDYGKGNGIKFIEPLEFVGNDEKMLIFTKACELCEINYNALGELGCRPQEKREVLNFSVASEGRITMNFRSLRNFFTLRCAKTAHLHIRQIAIPLLLYCKKHIPIVFDDIPYDEDFVKTYPDCMDIIDESFTEIDNMELQTKYMVREHLGIKLGEICDFIGYKIDYETDEILTEVAYCDNKLRIFFNDMRLIASDNDIITVDLPNATKVDMMVATYNEYVKLYGYTDTTAIFIGDLFDCTAEEDEEFKEALN